ncbi:MAG TPA: hypothetical protein VFQ90_14135 [Stellaceae bacterium]|nr:hypothetical protein [Stellaceae bacterium]
MRNRAEPSGITLTADNAALIKGMLRRGDRQHDIAAWFGVNGGRIAEIATGCRFAELQPAAGDRLPPPGPYPKARQAVAAIEALAAAKKALLAAEKVIRAYGG